tara:strand:+ start:2462 stop:4486 length:2025 start_codon:yes stop_codon:yes gene_type:complete
MMLITPANALNAGDGTQDAFVCEPPTLIGALYNTSYPYSFDIVDDHAYLASSGRLTVIDLSDPTNPQIIADTEIPVDTYDQRGFTVHKDALYLGNAIINIEDKSQPWYMRAGGAGGSVIINDFQYTSYMRMYNREFCPAYLDQSGFAFNEQAVGVINDHLITTHLSRYDITDPLNPVLIEPGSNDPGVSPDRFRFEYPNLIVQEKSNETAIHTYHPAIDAFTTTVLEDVFPSDLTIRGDLIFAAVENGISIYTNAPVPARLTHHDQGPGFENAKFIRQIDDHFIVVGWNSIGIYDIPTNPISMINTTHEHTHIEIEDDLAIASAGQIETSGLAASLFDLSDIRSPQWVADFPVDEPFGIELKDARAYIAAKRDGLMVFDVSPPSSPDLIATYNTSANQAGTPNTRDITIAGNHAYAIDRNAGLTTYELSATNELTPIGSLAFGQAAHRIGVQGNLAFVSGASALFIVDISDPTHPNTLSQIGILPGTRTYIQRPHLDGNLLYTPDLDNGYRIFDLSDPTQPIELAQFDADVVIDATTYTGLVYDLLTDQDLLYVAMSSFGFAVYDNTDPFNPVLLNHFHAQPEIDNNIRFREFARNNDRLHISAGKAGILTLDRNQCATCPIDLNNDGVLNFFDVTIFIESFINEIPAADLNNDDLFNFFDVSSFLVAYKAGCP